MLLVGGELEGSKEGPYEPMSCRRKPKLIDCWTPNSTLTATRGKSVASRAAFSIPVRITYTTGALECQRCQYLASRRPLRRDH